MRPHRDHRGDVLGRSAPSPTATVPPGRDAVSVFERFTDRARRVMVLAQEEARLLGHDFIGTEHLLLGLVHEGDGVAAKALTSLDFTLDSLRTAVEQEVPPSREFTPSGSPPFTPVAKKALELSLREALLLGHNYIGTEHMLLGILRSDESVGLRVLEQLGTDRALVRQTVISLLRLDPGSNPLHSQRPGWRFLTRDRRPPTLPTRPTLRQFEISGAVNVALTEGRLTGVAAGLPVDVNLDVPANTGTCAGSFAGADVSCAWRLAPNGQWVPDVPGWARGVFAGEQGELRGWFHLSDDLLFEHATIAGEFAGQPVSVLLEAGVAAKAEDAFRVQGSFCGSGFSLSCTFTDTIRVIGSVDGDPINLEATRPNTATDPRLRTVAGTFNGPSPLLFVSACALLFLV